MSQVRKLLQGAVIKAQNSTPGGLPESEAANKESTEKNKKRYGRLIIDGKEEVDGSEEDFLKFRDYVRTRPAKYGETYAGVLAKLERGEDVTTTVQNMYNVDNGHSHSGFSRFFQSLSPVETKAEAERAGILDLRRYTKTSNVKEEQTSKSKFTNTRRDFEWYDDDKGLYQKGHPTNDYITKQINTYLDWLSNPEEWEKSNEFTANHYDENLLKTWWDRFKTAPEGDTSTQRDRALAALQPYLTLVRGGNKKDWQTSKANNYENARDILRLFNIYGDPNESGGSSGSGNGAGRGVKKQGSLYSTRKGDASKGEYENGMYTDFLSGANGDTRMYYLTADRIANFTGLDDYLEGIIDPVTGRAYRYSELDAVDHRLSNGMTPAQFKKAVITANNSAKNVDSIYDIKNGVARLLNFTDYENNYGSYNNENNVIGNAAVQKILNDLGITDAAVFNPTAGYNTEGNRIYGVYDYTNGRFGNQNFNFRAPFYIIVDSNGNLVSRSNTIPYKANSGAYWDPVDDLYKSVRINGKNYGIATTVTDTHGEEHQILIDSEGKYWVYYGNKTHPISNEVLEKIKNKEAITRQDLIKGDTSTPTYTETEGVNHSGYARVRKEGGIISPKPLPVSKFQGGSKFMTTKTVAKDNQLKASSLDRGANLSTGQNLNFEGWWNGLNSNDKKDIYAAGLDVLSAVSALIPTPATAATALGLGVTSSGLMASADLNRGKSGWGVAGQTLLNVGLDAASAIPWLGESAAMAKIAKHVGRVGKWVGPIFTAAGLTQAAGAISKTMRGEKLTSEDLLALSAGFQSLLNIGHVKLKNAGDSSLAALGKKAAVNAPDAVHRKKTIGTGETAHEVVLTKEQAHDIAGTGSEAAANLRSVLQANGMSEAELAGITDTKLLKDWGFDLVVSKYGKNAGKVKDVRITGDPSIKSRVKDKLEGNDNNFNKHGYLTDFGRGQKRRTEYLDKLMQNAQSREALGKAVDEMDEGALGLRKLLTQRAYGRAEVRNGLPATAVGWRQFYQRVPGETTATSSNATSPSTSVPTTSNAVTSTTSNVNTKDFTLGASSSVQSPSRRSRKQLDISQNEDLLPVASVRTPKESKNPELPSIQQLFMREMPKHIEERVSRSIASKSLATQKRQYQTTAKVIEELRKPGADPMKILNSAYSEGKLAQSELDELIEALDYAVKNANKKIRVIDGKQLNRDEYKDVVEKLFLSMFKKGGTIINPKINAFTDKFKTSGILKARKGLFGGWNIDSTALKSSFLKDLPRGAKFLGAQYYNKANYDAAIKGIDDYTRLGQVSPTRYAGMSTATPVQDAQLNYWQQQLGKNPYYRTSDPVVNTMLKMQQDASIMPNINQSYRDLSTATQQLAMQQLSRDDRQRKEDNDAARYNRSLMAQGALSKSQAKQSYIQNKAQSFANLITQREQEITNALNKANEDKFAYDSNVLQNRYNTSWLDKVKELNPTVWDEWTSEPDQYRYSNDFNTWAQNTGRWNNDLAEAYQKHLEELGLEFDTLRRGFYSPSVQWATRHVDGVSSDNKKSGGKMRNRYKNEPWEDIWVNQNKATLKGVSKLNDNVIKILLKTLK